MLEMLAYGASASRSGQRRSAVTGATTDSACPRVSSRVPGDLVAQPARGGCRAHAPDGARRSPISRCRIRPRRASTIRRRCSSRSSAAELAALRSAAVRPAVRARGGRRRLPPARRARARQSRRPHREQQRELLAAVQAALRPRRLGARADAELSAVRAPDASRQRAGAAVRHGVPRRVADRPARTSATRSPTRRARCWSSARTIRLEAG